MRGADAEASRLTFGVCCTAGLVSVASLMLGAVSLSIENSLINAQASLTCSTRQCDGRVQRCQSQQ